MAVVPGEQFFADAEGRRIYRTLAMRILALGDDVETHVSKSQVAFHAGSGSGFAYAWRPGMYVATDVPVVASFVLDRELHTARIKEVAHPSKNRWMHHVELRDATHVDDELIGWIDEAHRRVVEPR